MGDRGNELKSFSNKKLKECKELCESVSGCTSITYEDSTLVCKLRDKIFTTDDTFEDGRYDGGTWTTYYRTCSKCRERCCCQYFVI